MDGRLVGGRYRLLEPHAGGGMASIWRATDELTGEFVAIKRLHPHLVADELARERLVREFAALSSLSHPNIVAVRDLVLDLEEPALVMEFVDGRTLANRIADDGPVPDNEALEIAAVVADGLGAAHARGVVHRDIKPANVLLANDGRPRLTDFGIAVTAGSDDVGLTMPDGVVGTMRYLAPERLTGQPADASSDVWGLGALLFEMTTGRPAVTETTLASRVDTATDPVARPSEVADATWVIIDRALSPDPADRYDDASAMASELHRASGTSPVDLVPTLDPSASTVVMNLPSSRIVEAVATGAPPGGPARVARPIRTRARTFGTAAIGLVTVLAIAVAMVALGGDGAGLERSSAAPPSTPDAFAPTPIASETVVEDEAGRDSAKVKGNGKGKGNGRKKRD